MVNLGELLKQAMADQLSRGQVFWVRNDMWRELYLHAASSKHPCLVCGSNFVFAPGTSQKRAAKWTKMQPFTLSKPEVLGGERSTFLLKL